MSQPLLKCEKIKMTKINGTAGSKNKATFFRINVSRKAIRQFRV